MAFLYPKSEETHSLVTGSITCVLPHIELQASDVWLLSCNYYDENGRVMQTVSDNHMGGQDVISQNFNFAGDLTQYRHNHSNGSENYAYEENYEYDHVRRLLSTTHTMGTQAPVKILNNKYDELGQLTRKVLNAQNPSASFSQEVDFAYNIKGWLKNINDPAEMKDDLFTMELTYENSQNPQWNGNISGMIWNSNMFKDVNQYLFTYDGASRISQANFADNGKYNVAFNYDKNGNIINLSRNGQLGEGGPFGQMDALTYTYEGNRLKSVDDNESSNEHQNNGFTDNASFADIEYLYDENGNMVKDLNKKIDNIEYTFNNLPTMIEIVQDGLNHIHYAYDALGNRLSKRTLSGRARGITNNYVENFVYERDSLIYVMTSEGRIVPRDCSFEYQYYIKDHLGNTRILFTQSDELLQDNSYYPFGMQMSGLDYTSGTSPENKYLYNGKELQDDFEREKAKFQLPKNKSQTNFKFEGSKNQTAALQMFVENLNRACSATKIPGNYDSLRKMRG